MTIRLLTSGFQWAAISHFTTSATITRIAHFIAPIFTIGGSIHIGIALFIITRSITVMGHISAITTTISTMAAGIITATTIVMYGITDDMVPVLQVDPA